jgi:hypothetical protein
MKKETSTKTPRKFSDYLKDKKREQETMETQFGSHSQDKKLDSMETQFGSHSQEKLNENDERESDHIHEKIAPISELTLDQKTAVKQYSDDSRPLNGFLHQHHKGVEFNSSKDKVRERIKHLGEALDAHKTTEDMHVYTGVPHSPAKHFKTSGSKVNATATVHLPAFTSTSSKLKCAKTFSEDTVHPKDDLHGIDHTDFGARHVLKIHVPKGSYAMSLKKHSFCPEEHEVLLHRGHNLEIDKNPEHLGSGHYMWHARVVSHTPAEINKAKEE